MNVRVHYMVIIMKKSKIKNYVDNMLELHKINKEFNTILDEVSENPDIANEAIEITIASFKKLIKELKELMK